MFPRYSHEANKMNGDGLNTSSGVSKLWKNDMEKVYTHVESAKGLLAVILGTAATVVAFTAGLCSHSAKKYATTAMTRTLSAIYVIFRAGWSVQNAHTIFDYLVKDAHR